MPDKPLAKGEPEWTSLSRHLTDVLQCADIMLQAVSPYVDAKTAASVRLAAIYHDLGKAACGMQAELRTGSRWGYRHEVLSAALLLCTGIQDNYPLVVPAILTHHKSLNDSKAILQDCTGANVPNDDADYFARKWQGRVSEMTEYWHWIREFIRRSDPDNGSLMASRLPQTPSELPDIAEYCRRLMEITQRDCRGLGAKSLSYVMVRGLLMAADHLASSGIGTPIIKLTCRRIRLRKFQRSLSEHKGSALLEAPTGSGKTRAAVAWALANRQAGERIFYVLPYQASINAMARVLENDRGFGFGSDAVGIIHHRAFLQEFRRYLDGQSDYARAHDAACARMDQTRKFYRPIKVITPYQILKLLFGGKRFEIGLSEMLGGLVIFDEIHAYEPHVAALIDVAVSRLKILGVRYLFMSATFPPFLKDRLFAAVPDMRSFGLCGRDEWERRLLSMARHRLILHNSDLESLIPDIIEAARRGTVLVVCNRIAQAKQIFDVLKKKIRSISLLHGGFTALDRWEKEKKLFKQQGSRQPACRVLVATQVIEVSLDISFGTIYTEIAPVDDLLQRFGRVNRTYERKRAVDVHVATVFDADKLRHVYNLERLKITRNTAPDGLELTPVEERNWIQAVYSDGFLDHENAIYEGARESFERVVDNLAPMYDGDNAEFFEMFNSIPVLPAELFDEYSQARKERRYLNAEELLLSLHVGTFRKLEQEGAIASIRLGDMHESPVFVVKRHYDTLSGLTDEPVPLPAALI